MSQSPVTVTYSLEEILTRIEGKIDCLNEKVGERLGKLEVGQVRIEETIDGVSKRLENQDFITRGILVGLVLAFLAGFAKLFGVIGNS